MKAFVYPVLCSLVLAVCLCGSASAEDYPRVPHSPEFRSKVFEQNRSWLTGKVYDPLTGKEIKPTDTYDLGHKPGNEYWRMKEEAVKSNLPKDVWKASQKETYNYRPELPSSNRSHALEVPRMPKVPKSPPPSSIKTFFKMLSIVL